MATTVEAALRRAFRMSGIKADGESLTYSEGADGLDLYNQTIRGMHGTVIGVPLVTVDASTTTAMHGALYQGGTATFTLTMPSNPRDGWRIGVADARGGFASFNATIAPGGRKLENATANITLNTNNDHRTWFFRADTGDWQKEKDLTLTDNVYFPDDLMGHLIPILAVTLCNEYGKEPPAQTKELAVMGLGAFRNRYGRRGDPDASKAAA